MLLSLQYFCLSLPPNTGTRGDVGHESDEMAIRGDINHGDNGQTKGSVGEDRATAAPEYDQVDALPSFLTLLYH